MKERVKTCVKSMLHAMAEMEKKYPGHWQFGFALNSLRTQYGRELSPGEVFIMAKQSFKDPIGSQPVWLPIWIKAFETLENSDADYIAKSYKLVMNALEKAQENKEAVE